MRRRYPGFHLLLRTEGTGLLRDGDRVAGVTAQTPEGPLDIRAGLVVGDRRAAFHHARAAGLKVIDRGAPMDVLWLRLSRRDGDPGQTLGRVDAGRIMVMLDRGDYWQCAFLIAKGGFDAVRNGGAGCVPRGDRSPGAAFSRPGCTRSQAGTTSSC